jgi:hypothetical protein
VNEKTWKFCFALFIVKLGKYLLMSDYRSIWRVPISMSKFIFVSFRLILRDIPIHVSAEYRVRFVCGMTSVVRVVMSWFDDSRDDWTYKHRCLWIILIGAHAGNCRFSMRGSDSWICILHISYNLSFKKWTPKLIVDLSFQSRNSNGDRAGLRYGNLANLGARGRLIRPWMTERQFDR